MNWTKLLKHIVENPAVKVGTPVIKGTGQTVDFILNELTHGAAETS